MKSNNVSWWPLFFLFGTLGMTVGRNLSVGGRLVGTLIGVAFGFTITKLINRNNWSKSKKLRWTWVVAGVGIVFYFIVFGLTLPTRLPEASKIIKQELKTESPKPSGIQPIIENISKMSDAQKKELLSRFTDEEKEILKQYPEFSTLFQSKDKK